MTPWVQRLLIANIGMFFLQSTVGGVKESLEFVPALALSQPWTLVTYMFLHGGFSHIAFNMIALYFFGPQVEARLGTRRFFILYFIGGVSGAAVSSIFAPYTAIIGASAAVYGVMLAFAWFWPHMRIYIWGVLPIEARWLVVITTMISLWSGLKGSTGGVADFAHLGGYAGAFLYLRWTTSGRSAKKFRKRAIGDVPAQTLEGKWSRVDPSTVHELNRDEVNRILDKIKAQGVSSLTAEEKVFLANFVPPEKAN